MSKKTKKEEIGLGIRALLRGFDDINPKTEDGLKKATKVLGTVATLPLTSIEVNPFQPRVEFDEERLQELAQSIKIHGVIQPITVRKGDGENFQLISGERRLRASKIAGLEAIPAYIRIADDQEILEMALIENIQREDLNALEVSVNYQRLIEECSLTHEDLAERLGKSRSTITNFLRLLNLPAEIKAGIKNKEISMGHARCLSGLKSESKQLAIYQRIIAEGLSVRKVEALVKGDNKGVHGKNMTPAVASYITDKHIAATEELTAFFGTKVAIRNKSNGKGELVISFASDKELNAITEKLKTD